MSVLRRIGQNVQRLRALKGWSQEELADRAGLHRTYISGIERGIRNPTATVLERIAIGLEVTLSELVA